MKGWLFLMKKIIIALSVLLLIFVCSNKDEIIIPKESIRFRIISNSNSSKDIIMKQTAANEVIKVFNNIETQDIESTRKVILNNLDTINTNINNLFKENNYNKKIDINYGINKFPEKKYKGVKYEEGLYESLVINIGESKGNNFWCVLFPPLCLIDEEQEKIEYKSKIEELIKKYF